MRCGYFDCFSGVAGDMILGAMVNAGLALDALREVVARLDLTGVTVESEAVKRGGLAGTLVRVKVASEPEQAHHHLPDILKLIAQGGFAPAVGERAGRIFRRLAEAEATAHAIPVEKVHFHEVGAADALVDIVGACVGIEALGIDTIICSPIPTGCGTVECDHGTLPVPAPATAELLRGVPLTESDEQAELTTPTGAAVLATLADSFGGPPAMVTGVIGYGAGTRENCSRPNLLRLMIGDLPEERADECDRVVVLETQVDDATGQAVAFAIGRLLEAGAVDAYAVPILMKKGRPGQLLSVLCRPEDAGALEGILFSETTTFGVRRHECARRILARVQETVETEYGSIRVKVGRRGDRVLQAWPEYEDCAAAARAGGAALRTVQDAALREWNGRHGNRDSGRYG